MAKTIASARRRSAAILSVGALTITGLMAVAMPADAVITRSAGATNNVPNYFRDDIGLRVAPCENVAVCVDPFDPADGVYFDAGADTQSIRAVFSVGAGFDPLEPPVEIDNSFRFSNVAPIPNGRYTMRHPCGTATCNAAGGTMDCRSALTARPVRTFLRTLARPAGFLGNGETPRRVTGSPSGFNRLVIDGPGAFRESTNLFTVLGQMPAATPMADIAKDALTMGNRNKTTPTTRILRYESLGTANASATATVAGRNAARFTVNDAACASVAPGNSCGIRVTYRPQRNRNAAARLRIVTAGNAGATRVVTLRGTGPVRR